VLLRGKWRNFLLVPASLAFGICLIEGAANIWEPKEVTVVSPPYGLYTTRPIIGEGPDRAGLFHQQKTDQSTGATVYNVDYSIDSNLLRHTQSCETGPAIVFFGCSFMFGAGLNDADTLAQAFADSLDRKERVLNLGFPGYGPQQFLSEMQSGLFDPAIGPQSGEDFGPFRQIERCDYSIAFNPLVHAELVTDILTPHHEELCVKLFFQLSLPLKG
jgi:hypothetical protein